MHFFNCITNTPRSLSGNALNTRHHHRACPAVQPGTKHGFDGAGFVAAAPATWATAFIFFGSWESFTLFDSWTLAVQGACANNSAITLAVIPSLFSTNKKNSLAQLARSGFSKSQRSNSVVGSLLVNSLNLQPNPTHQPIHAGLTPFLQIEVDYRRCLTLENLHLESFCTPWCSWAPVPRTGLVGRTCC